VTVKAPDPARRSERSRQAVLDAAIRLCRDRGYERTTIEAIAAEAGVGKQTIYRWWPSKGAVIMDALTEESAASADFPDTGNVRADLRRQMTSVVELLAGTDFGPLYRGVIAALQSDPELAATVRERIVEPRVTACVERLRRAQRSGELRRGIDLESVVELLYGPIYYRLLLPGRPLDPTGVGAMVDLAFAGLKRSPPRRR
jgi:AcrR family transcriptional regulator